MLELNSAKYNTFYKVRLSSPECLQLQISI